jgi:catechol 2,3-dioxygenase-like lactoylglutathione lyase family enzyme
MICIREIDHLVLRVVNIDSMLRFYCGVLGCTVERRQDEIGLIQCELADLSLISYLWMANSAERAAQHLERKPATWITSAFG